MKGLLLLGLAGLVGGTAYALAHKSSVSDKDRTDAIDTLMLAKGNPDQVRLAVQTALDDLYVAAGNQIPATGTANLSAEAAQAYELVVADISGTVQPGYDATVATLDLLWEQGAWYEAMQVADAIGTLWGQP